MDREAWRASPRGRKESDTTERLTLLLLPHHPAIILLGICLKKMKTLIWKDICSSMFIVALFTVTKYGSKHKCPSVEEWIKIEQKIFSCSVSQSCPTLCDSTDCSTPGFPVLHHLLEFAQTHVHWVGDAIPPSHPLSSPSPPACNLSQDQGLFQ